MLVFNRIKGNEMKKINKYHLVTIILSYVYIVLTRYNMLSDFYNGLYLTLLFLFIFFMLLNHDHNI